MEEHGAIEQEKDLGHDSQAEVKRWLKEIQLADDAEKDWREDAKEAIKIHRSAEKIGPDRSKRKETFNILWSNIETERPALYNSLPKPDIRRRFRDKDPIGKAVSELMERCASYTLDMDYNGTDFDDVMIAAVNDELLPGRAVTRVRYKPVFDGDELVSESVCFEQVQWDDFKRGPAKTWGKVPWICFDHRLTRKQIKEKFPGFEDKVKYDITLDEQEENEETDQGLFKRCLVHEIWNKDTREVIFIAPNYKDGPLKKEKDKMGLQGFYPIPAPLYDVESSTSLVPVTRYSMYETLAKELETITRRLNLVTKAIRVRGIYDSRITEIEKVFDAGDNKFIPATNVAALLDAGGLEKAIWMLPLETLMQVGQALTVQRQQLIQQIYEITGISDILRGATDPDETLGAQEIKANFGTQRLQNRQRAVQRYARDLIRIAVELMAEKFSRQTMAMMSGLNFPTQEDKARAQQVLQYAQQMGPQQPQIMQQAQQAQEVLQQPAWEEIEQVLKSDLLRTYRVDIETDSTIQAELQDDQKNITELLGGITTFMEGITPAIQSGVVTVDIAKQFLLAAVRRFKLGRTVEDAIDDIQAPQPVGDIEEAKKAMEAQFAEKEKMLQAQMQLKEGQIQVEADQKTVALERQAVEMERKAIDLEKQNLELVAKNVQLEQAGVNLEKHGVELSRKEMDVTKKGYENELTGKSNELQGRENQIVIKEGEGKNAELSTKVQESSMAVLEKAGEMMERAGEALAKAAEMLAQDREVELIRDAQGRAVGSRSKVVRAA